MNGRNRREFLADVGRGMLVASLGTATAIELGISPGIAQEAAAKRLSFGELEPLVSLMQETPPEKLLPVLVNQLQGGTPLKTLVTSAALANARAFGGQDYTGYHTFMAMVPAYQMAAELPSDRAALPVLKVLYRNTSRIHDQQKHDHDTLQPVTATAVDANRAGEQLRQSVRDVDWNGAEARFAGLAAGELDNAFDALQYAVQDEINVHRVVLAWRAWAMLDLTGQQYAHSLLRQSVRFCLDSEQRSRDRNYDTSPVREIVPRLLDEHKLLAKKPGKRQADDKWIDSMARTVFSANRDQAAAAVAAALAEGIDPEAVGEAISLAANLLVLHDPGRAERNSSREKPPGCVHGDSVGVHASDAANAWRNIARVSSPRNTYASLIVGAYHTAGQHGQVTEQPYPYTEQLEALTATSSDTLLAQAEEAIRANDQARACALIDRYGQLNLPQRPVLNLMLKYAVSEDGALHAEKYYRTVSEEFSTTREAYRWRQMIALARVTASEYGFPAPGYAEACELLGVG